MNCLAVHEKTKLKSPIPSFSINCMLEYFATERYVYHRRLRKIVSVFKAYSFLTELFRTFNTGFLIVGLKSLKRFIRKPLVLESLYTCFAHTCNMNDIPDIELLVLYKVVPLEKSKPSGNPLFHHCLLILFTVIDTERISTGSLNRTR